MELSKPKALFPEVDAATQVELKRMESWLDNQELQRQDHTASCTFLGIQDEAKPRLAGMASTFVLKFWQPVAIAGLIRIEDRPAAAKMHSAMLCDGVGLGKTTVIGSVVLYVSLFACVLPRIGSAAMLTQLIESTTTQKHRG